jgi:hypothetical protein
MRTRDFTALALAISLHVGHAATVDDVRRTFDPYADGFPVFPGMTPGMKITKDNAEQFKDSMDAGLFLTAKNGWDELVVGPTTQFEMDRHYVEATIKNIGTAKLGAKNGELVGFVAGRPFPEEPNLSDPRAGEKVAWNYKYGVNWGDGAAIYPFYWKYRNMQTGQVERTIKFDFNFLNFRHRVEYAPLPEVLPNPSELFRGIYVKVLEPQDLKDTQLLIQRYDDDLKLDDAYLYLGFQRRVRRLATGQTTDAFLGSDLMIEDFEGYNARVSDMKWKYLGTKNILMPFYYHNELTLSNEFVEPDGYKFVEFGGHGGCFPRITWQLRKVYIVEADPVNEGHPIGKRILFIDAQRSTINRALIYDKKGDLWKIFTIGKAHPDHHLAVNKGSGIAIDDSFSMVDVQSNHCTTGQFKGQVDPKLNPASLFQVQNMRGSN